MLSSLKLPRFKTYASSSANIFGSVEAPPGVANYDSSSGGSIGIILFASRLIRLITIAGGIFVMVNLLYAGWIYLSSMGDTNAHSKAINTIVFSVMGLAIIVASYAVAGLIGLIFFGDATYILNPQICGPQGC